MQPKTATLEMNEKTDQLIIKNTRCPVCGKRGGSHTPYVTIPCNCGISYKTDFEQDTYTKVSPHVLAMVSWNDETILKFSEAYEGGLIRLQKYFKMQNCWEVSEITSKIEEHRRCLKCGVCRDCLTCKNCGKTFKKDTDKNKGRRRQLCPHCKSDKFIKTFINEVFVAEKNKEIRLCPHCKSDKLIMTRTTNKTKCHVCGSEELSLPKTERIFTMTIKRKEPYMINNA